MKQCPTCKGLELYDDAETYCPHCNSVLVPYIRNSRRRPGNDAQDEAPIRPAPRQESRQNEEPEFERRMGGRIVYRGIVDSITPTSRFMPRALKWANAVFGGQPYQFGNPVHETILRIEEISSSRLPDRLRSLVYYGELGELDIGDDVNITAIRKSNRLVIKNIVINDIETTVKPHGQVSAAAVRIFTILSILCVVLLVSSIVSFFTSGGLWVLLGALVGGTLNLAGKLLTVLAPIIGLLFVYWLFFRRR
jgi:hypothetical protein